MSINMVVAADFEFNVTALPFNANVSSLITTSNNMVANMSYQQFLSGIPQYFINDTTNFTLNVSIDIPVNTAIGNYTSIVNITAFNSTTTLNGILNFSLNVLNTTNASINITINESQYALVGLNTIQYVNICDVSLPFNTTFTTSIDLNFDTISTCDDFLSCPHDLTQDISEVTINISIPSGTQIGTYTKYAIFGVQDLSNITFVFKVNSCARNVSDVCNEVIGEPNLVLCPKDIIQSIIDRNVTNVRTVIYYENTTNTTIREVFDINDPDKIAILDGITNITRTYLLTVDENQRLRYELANTSQTLNACADEQKRFALQFPEFLRSSVDELTQYNKNVTERLRSTEKATWGKGKVIGSILVIIIVTVSVIGYMFYRKKKVL